MHESDSFILVNLIASIAAQRQLSSLKLKLTKKT